MFAAAVAAAMAPGATPASVFAAAVGVAHDGTRAALLAVETAAASGDGRRTRGRRLRAAIAPFDTVGPNYREPSMDARRPIADEVHRGTSGGARLRPRVRRRRTGAPSSAAVNYGRDADSIAAMAGAITGALNGVAAVPADGGGPRSPRPAASTSSSPVA